MGSTTNMQPLDGQPYPVPQAEVPLQVSPDWQNADFDSFEVLVTLGFSNPIGRVTRARMSNRMEGAS